MELLPVVTLGPIGSCTLCIGNFSNVIVLFFRLKKNLLVYLPLLLKLLSSLMLRLTCTAIYVNCLTHELLGTILDIQCILLLVRFLLFVIVALIKTWK